MKLTTSTLPSAFRWWSTMKLPHPAKRDLVYILRLAMSSLRCCRCLQYMVAMSLVCYFFFVVYVSVFFKPKVLKVRYQHVPPDNLSPTPELLVPKFDSVQGLNKNQRQQIPTTDSALEPPSSNARQVTLSHCNQLYSSRYHLGHFPTQYPHVSSLVHATSRDAPVRFIPSLYERPFPCGSALDLISSNSSNMDGDHRLNPMGTTGPEEPSITNVTNPSRENRKRTVPVVIACRLWQVSH